MCKAAWLSQNINAAPEYDACKSLNKYLNHVSSQVAATIEQYYTSSNDLDTITCFLLFKDTSEFSRKMK